MNDKTYTVALRSAQRAIARALIATYKAEVILQAHRGAVLIRKDLQELETRSVALGGLIQTEIDRSLGGENGKAN